MSTPRRDLWTPTAGILAAVTFVVGFAMTAGSTPDSTDPDAKIISWYADTGRLPPAGGRRTNSWSEVA